MLQGYDLDEPSEVIILNSELKEISGLAIEKDHFFAIEDEHGKVYVLDRVSGVILDSWKFHDKGDFEDLVVVDSVVYIMKSNGKIYQTRLFDDEDNTIKCDPGFSASWNFEGMTYFEEENRLLMAAKRSSSSRVKEIYCVHFDEKCNDLYPKCNIDQVQIGEYYRSRKKTWIARLSHDISNVKYSFNPSALDIHPLTGKVFVLSSPVPQLLVLDEKWQVEEAVFLDPSLFKQPESLCFDPEGNMYIANEGAGSKANILKFSIK